MIGVNTLFLLSLGILFALTAVPWYIGLRRGRLDLFEPIIFKSVFVAMMGFVLFGRVFVRESYILHDQVVTRDFTEGFILVTILYVVLFASILVGYYSSIGNRAISTEGILDPENYRVEQVRLVALVYVGIGLVAYLSFVYLAIPGGNVFYLYTTTTPRSEIFSGYQFLVASSQLVYIGYFLWITCALVQFDVARVRDLVGLPILLLMFFVLGSRYVLMQLVLVTTVLYYYGFYFGSIRVRNPRLRRVAEAPMTVKAAVIGIGGFAAATFLPIAQHLRGGRGPRKAIERTDYISIFTSGVHDDTPDYLLALVEVVPEEFGYFYGTMYLRVIANFVPRAIWEGKPVLTTGGLLRRAILPDQSGGRDPGEIGSYFVNFGYPGVVLMGGVFGVLTRILYETLRANRRSPLVFLVYAFCLISVVRAGFVNNMLFHLATSLLVLLPVVLLHLPQLEPLFSKIRNGVPGTSE